jgi:integrase
MRPANQAKSPRGYTSKEIERLLAACHKFYSTKTSLNRPGDWLRGVVAISLSTGLHPSELLKINGGLSSPGTHNWQSLCATFRQTMCQVFS